MAPLMNTTELIAIGFLFQSVSHYKPLFPTVHCVNFCMFI
jgi:hypothetical protein